MAIAASFFTPSLSPAPLTWCKARSSRSIASSGTTPRESMTWALHHVSGAGLKLGVKKDAAIAISLTLEFQGEVKVLEVSSGSKIAVIFGSSDAMDSAVFNVPFFIAHVYPAIQVLAVEQRYPILAGSFGFASLGGHRRRE